MQSVRIQLLDEKTGAVVEDVDVVTSAGCVFFPDGETFQQKLDKGALRGPQGLKGDAGATGERGPQGLQGPKGDPGPKGAQGIQGIQGPQGPQGPQGNRGPQGDPGDTIKVGASITSAVNRKLFFKVMT